MTRVLILDDDPNIGDSLVRGLRGRGWTVSAETDAKRAVERHATEPFHVIVTDIMMPGMDGNRLIRILRDAPRRPAIVAMTGEPPQFGFDFLETARELGADATIAKPFRAEELAALIGQLALAD